MNLIWGSLNAGKHNTFVNDNWFTWNKFRLKVLAEIEKKGLGGYQGFLHKSNSITLLKLFHYTECEHSEHLGLECRSGGRGS